MHSGERPHKCTMCEKSFATSDQLAVHIDVHNVGKLYKCEVCGKAYQQAISLRKHKQMHTFEQP